MNPGMAGAAMGAGRTAQRPSQMGGKGKGAPWGTFATEADAMQGVQGGMQMGATGPAGAGCINPGMVRGNFQQGVRPRPAGGCMPGMGGMGMGMGGMGGGDWGCGNMGGGN